MFRISQLASSVKPSATLAAGAKAKALEASGTTVYDFSLGEPDFDTPQHIAHAAAEAVKNGQTHYTPASGTVAVRQAIADWYAKTYQLHTTPKNIVVSNGAKHSIHNALIATVGAGDEVVIPTPYWVSYSDLVAMTGAAPVLVQTSLESRFKMTPQQLRQSITPRTRMVMLNSPNNPTGAVYTRAELEALVDVILETDVTILSDEIYELLTYGDAKPTCVATLRPGLSERTITVSGASKSYAMTGWRMGWAIAPLNVAKAMDTVQSQETSCPSSVSQAALIAALSSPESAGCVERMRAEFAERREFVYAKLAAMPGVRFDRAEGAFYAFFEVAAYFGKTFGSTVVGDSAGFCAACLEQAHVNLVPGSAFGCEGFVRMSFAAKRSTLDAGLGRLAAFLASGR